MSKWREFTIHLRDRYFVEAVGFDSKNTVHVIEYSAYESQQKRIEQLEAELKNKDAVRIWNENEILRSKESQFKSTLAATIAEKDKLLRANKVLKTLVSSAKGVQTEIYSAGVIDYMNESSSFANIFNRRLKALNKALESADKIMKGE